MYPTATVEHLVSITAVDDSADVKIYEFDRESSADFLPMNWCATSPGTRSFVRYEEVLAA
ncbi:hypothetical protein [Lentzea sp. HUAS12]|uniref:hypothetical protein n=1 Tax=Lentzea sp. HUAS12 TaxID=2951806 RepID=UPI00209D0818|nr:hypothetical protein [Lentzea sp. HUAS12]USX48320.1 hypothetical protein ND450_22825 [Lentzea sp. HUAS12]